MTAPNSAPKKVLVIGSTGHAGVKCVDWTRLKDVPNIADFPVVVLNTCTLAAWIEALRAARDSAEEKQVDDLEKTSSSVSEGLSLLKSKLIRVLRAGGVVYAILSGYTAIWHPGRYSYEILNSHQWMPLPVSLRGEPGEGLMVREERFTRYFASVARWERVIEGQYEVEPLKAVTERELEPKPLVQLASTQLATDWQGNAVGAALQYTLHHPAAGDVTHALLPAYADRPYERQPYLQSGPLVLLPPPTEVSEDEAVRILLEDCCGIQARATAPAWAVSLELPANRELQGEIRARRADIDNIHKQLEPLLKEKERREAFKAILYETGISPLQETVEAAFKELGFKTLPSDVSDEFYIEFKSTRVLLEVKGHDKSASLTDLRQLIDYQLQHEQKHGTPVKCVLVVNAWRKLAPEKRGLPGTVFFPDNVVRRAQPNNIALLDTVQLFDALNALWLEKIGTQQLFDKLLNTQGVVTLVD